MFVTIGPSPNRGTGDGISLGKLNIAYPLDYGPGSVDGSAMSLREVIFCFHMLYPEKLIYSLRFASYRVAVGTV